MVGRSIFVVFNPNVAITLSYMSTPHSIPPYHYPFAVSLANHMYNTQPSKYQLPTNAHVVWSNVYEPCAMVR